MEREARRRRRSRWSGVDISISRRARLPTALSNFREESRWRCTELGVWAFWPVIARRSVTRPDAAAVDKWARRAIEAAKQSQRAFVPTFEPPRLITACLDRSNEFDALVMAHRTHPGKGWADFLKNHPDKLSILVFVGPEGGWSDEEVGACLAAGAHPVCLGPTVLRTETAAIAVCAAVALEQRSD
jgi:16S rRNA (uracil1498-N3)-methyltransferase